MVRGKLIAAILMTSVAARSLAQEHQHGNGEKLGTVTFATSCNEVAQKEFNRAVALLHSFQFSRAIEGFNAVLRQDQTCGIAYWGIALSDWSNPFAPGMKDKSQLQAGRENAERGRTVGTKTERERMYIAAAGKLYSDYASTPQRARLIAYRDAMERSRQNIKEITKRRSSTRWHSRLRKIPRTRRTSTGSRQERFSRNCSRRNRCILGWHITSSIPTTCPRWLAGRWWRRGVTRKLLPMRHMHCTCRRIRSRARVTGKSRSTPT